MARGLIPCLAASLLLVGCSDSSDRLPPATTPAPPTTTDLEDTGIYQGLVRTSEQVALITVTLARNGQTAIAIDSDDDERADILLWGSTSISGGQLAFTGRDHRDDAQVSLVFQVEDGVLRSEVDLSGLAGEAVAPLAPHSAAPADPPSGRYARQDSLEGFTGLDIATDGGINPGASCSGGGTLDAPDPEVNIYAVTLDSDCLNWQALASLEQLEDGSRLLSITGAEGLATRLYQQH